MKMRNLLIFVLLLALAAIIHGCSSGSSDAPAVNEAHPDGWVLTHGAEYQADPNGCKSCHGINYEGSGKAPACNSCHLGSAPDFGLHPDSWGADTLAGHQPFAFDYSWTTCSVAECHGADLKGGHGSGPTGPSCLSASYVNGAGQTAFCHDTGPPPPHGMPNTSAQDHGLDAKNFSGNGHDQLYCRNCHGLPPNNFDGGFVNSAILERTVLFGACTTCHAAAKAHYANWQGSNDGGTGDKDPSHSSTHRTVPQVTVDRSCSLCHKTTSAGPGPLAGSPSCFNSTFTNANGITSGCHPDGPGGAPHDTDGSYRSPSAHGPDAKTTLGLNSCKDCHARQVGGDYRFDVQVGDLHAGCEDCHAVNTAHPDADQWTFRGSLTSTRRTHFASADPVANCGLCHGASLTGGSGPTCYTCHDPATTLPAFTLQCTFCHGNPPDGTGDQTGSTTPVDHLFGAAGDVSAIGLHEVCSICHGASDSGSGALTPKNANYVIFDRVSSPQGGDHLDGQIEMNGPSSTNTGAGYDPATFGCTRACHVNDGAHQMPNGSGLTVAFGDYTGGGGSGTCDACHGYPPDGNPEPVVGGTPVSHLFADNGVTLLANHNECVTCHGTKDDGSGSHAPGGVYNPSVDHQDTNLNLNINVQYDPVTRGCNAACHPNNATYQFPNSSGLTIVEGDYGAAGCAACHDTGVGGAPVVLDTSSHATGGCESCHPGGLRGVQHGAGGDPNVVLIPNNTAVGINYTGNGETGIYIGGDNTTGTTEAEICWNCHGTFLVSEWGQNNNANTGNSLYDYGSVDTPNWTVATWTSAEATLFAYKTGAIQSTHAADPAAVAAGVDAVGALRCSYCHDVHDLNQAPNDVVSGQPYLRGTWKGNPYLEDGAPQLGSVFDNTPRAGAVPRGNPATGSDDPSTLGGYQIDQNNNYPTWDTTNGVPKAGWAPEDFGGLCELCHGNGDGTWTATEIDNLNMFGTPANAWLGVNGHANSVIGGTGAGSLNATNIFDLRGGNLGNSTDPAMVFRGANNPGKSTRGFRGYGSNAAGWLPNTTTSKPRLYNDGTDRYAWGATIDSTTNDDQYHHFSCSKCHSPHATRLPRLLITNCLDTKQNTWDNSYQLASGPQAGTNNIGRSISNWTSAQNCHRRVGNDETDTRDTAGYEGTGAEGDRGGLGWNFLTPFTSTGQENPGIP